MTDLLLAGISLIGAWAYAVVAVAVHRQVRERTTKGWGIAATWVTWVTWLLGTTAVFALTGLADGWVAHHSVGAMGVVTVFALAVPAVAATAYGGSYYAEPAQSAVVTAALWPVAGLCWLVARSAVIAARVVAVCATVAVAPARMVGRKRIAAGGRDERIAELEKELEIGGSA